MNILVVLRAVQDPLGITVNRKAEKVFINRPAAICNPSDRNALEAALRLGGNVTVTAVGGAPAEQVLRDARAAGAQRALLIKDKALVSADAYGLTHVLRRVVEHLDGVDLVLCGAETLDADLAQAGPRLAQALGWPFAEDAHQITVADGEARFTAWRAGAWQQAAVSLPAVLAIPADSNKPRLAPGKNLINIYTDAGAVEVLKAADLGLTEAELTPVTEARGQAFPPEREPGKRVGAAELADILRRI